MTKLDEDFIYQVCLVVEEIPIGKVITYGQLATLCGHGKNSRLVGRALKVSGRFGTYPCHRVVNHQGRTVPGWLEQKQLLENEGVKFKPNGLVDLKECQWET